MSYNYTAATAALTAIYGVGIAGCLYISTRLVLDLISQNKISGKTLHADVESDPPSRTKGSMIIVRIVALAAVICAFIDNILSIVILWSYGADREEYMARHTALYFFATFETALVFITALLVSGKFTASSPMSFLRAIRYVFIVFIGLFAGTLSIMGALTLYSRSARSDLDTAYPNFGHAYLALLAVTTFAITASLFMRISHVRSVGISKAERCALYAFTSVTVPVLTGQVILSIVSRVDRSVTGFDAFLDNMNGYLAYTYISAILNVLGNMLILELARKAAKKLSTC